MLGKQILETEGNSTRFIAGEAINSSVSILQRCISVLNMGGLTRACECLFFHEADKMADIHTDSNQHQPRFLQPCGYYSHHW